MTEAIYACPFCDEPPYRTRYMLWRHIHECLKKTKVYEPVLGINPDGLAVDLATH